MGVKLNNRIGLYSYFANITGQIKLSKLICYKSSFCKLGLLAIIVFTSATSYSQSQSIYTPNSYWDSYSIRNIGMEDGLPSEPVFYSYEDSLGFIWIVSSNGLVRYDGLSIKTYSTGYTGGFLYEAHKDKDGNLWIPSINTGVHKFDGERFIAFKDELKSSEGLAKTLTINKGGSIFIGMYGTGLIEFDGKKVISKYNEEDGLVANTIWRIINDRQGRIWIGTDNGLSIFENGKFTNFTSENGLPHNKIRGLTEMMNGDVWVGMDGGGIAIFREMKPYKFYNKEDGLNGEFIQFFGQNPIDSTIWIAHHGDGLDVFKDGKIEAITENEGLPSNFLTYIGFSKDGTGYVGSEMGLSILTKKLINTIDKNTPGIDSNPSISVVEENNNTIWIGLERRGFRYFLKDKWNKLEDPPVLTNGYPNGATKDPNGGVWFSTQGSGIIKIKNQQIEAHINEKDGLLNDFSNGLTIDRDGLLWVGTNKGINVIDKDLRIIKSYTTEDGLPNNFCLTISSSSDGSIWYGSYGGGLARIYEDEITVFDSSSGVFGSSIYSIFEHSNGDVLVTGNPGILSVFNGTDVDYYGTDAGIPNTTLFGITEDDKGNIWASSEIGIFRIDIEDFIRLRRGEIDRINYVQYTSEDGMPTEILESGTNAPLSRIHTGEILFASSQGTIVLNPEEVSISTESFFPYINEFIVDEQKLSLVSSRELTPKDKKIEISFSALNIKSPKKTKFRIRLEGIDDEWIYVGERTSAFYDYLPDGKYSFHVSAIGPDGQWSDKTASISFTVLPPFYKTWWFMSLGLLGFIAIGAGGVQIKSNIKVRKLNRELAYQQKFHKEKERISRDLHDNVGSQITNLITGIEISNIHIAKGQDQKAGEILKNLDEDARNTMNDLRETIWLLDKEEVSFFDFEKHLRTYIRRQKRYFFGVNVLLEVAVENNFALAPSQSLNLIRIIQEALNNARKYAEASIIEISIFMDENSLHVIIADNGKGMNVSQELEKGNGLKNMEYRSKEIFADFNIESNVEKGTTISLKLQPKLEKLP